MELSALLSDEILGPERCDVFELYCNPWRDQKMMNLKTATQRVFAISASKMCRMTNKNVFFCVNQTLKSDSIKETIGYCNLGEFFIALRRLLKTEIDLTEISRSIMYPMSLNL